MELSSDLVSQFIKVVEPKQQTKKESTLYGTVRKNGDEYQVRLDGADEDTPVITTADYENGERVIVTIKDHTAIVTGNLSSPAARSTVVKTIDNASDYTVSGTDAQYVNAFIENLYSTFGTIGELGVNILEAIQADIDTLSAKVIEGEKLTVSDLTSVNATIDNIKAKYGEFEGLSTETITALDAEITTLKGHTANFTYFSATKADIEELTSTLIDAETGNFKFAEIDFANINEAAIRRILADTGLIKDLHVGDQQVSGELIGVTIRGDSIIAGTLKADQLIIRGSDGKYYSLNTDFFSIDGYTYRKASVTNIDGIRDGELCENMVTPDNEPVYKGLREVDGSDVYYTIDADGNCYVVERIPGVEPMADEAIHGSSIAAKTITADKLAVNDISAFEATIGGFHIGGDGYHYEKTAEIFVPTEAQRYEDAFTIDNEQIYSCIDADDNWEYCVLDSSGNYFIVKRVYDERGSIYSGAKAGVDSGESGIYLGNDGQVSIGDAYNYLKFIKETGEDGVEKFRLYISADSIQFGQDTKRALQDIVPLTERVKIGTWIDETGNERPSIELAEGDSQFKQIVTNVSSRIMDGATVVTEMDTDGIETENITVRREIRQGRWAWIEHGEGNLGLMWKKGVTE
jgi:uncharacterized protein YjbI with pentapeptide repeats